MPAAKALKKAGLSLTGIYQKSRWRWLRHKHDDRNSRTGCRESLANLIRAVYATALSVHCPEGERSALSSDNRPSKTIPRSGVCCRPDFSSFTDQDSARQLEDDALETLQDPYSLRCAPQVVGVLYDGLSWIKKWVEIEANSSNDNPIFDPATGEVLMGGNFYGGHIAFAMDGLKSRVGFRCRYVRSAR